MGASVFKRFIPLLIVLILTSSLTFLSCSGGGGSGGTNTPSTNTGGGSTGPNIYGTGSNVAITIIGLGETIKVTNKQQISITGVASSDVGIKKVTFTNKTTGESGEASGYDNWTATVNLTEGDNELEFTAITQDDKKASVQTVITYYPELNFNTALTPSKDILFVNEANTVNFTIGVVLKSGQVIKLYRVNESGQVIQPTNSNNTYVVEMKDNGKLPDEIEGDGIYSAQVKVESNQTGYVCFRAVVETSGNTDYQSETSCLFVTTHLTNQDVNTSVNIANNVKKQLDQALTTTSISDAAKSIVDQLKQDPNIEAAGYTENGGIWWLTKSGIAGVYHPVFDGSKGGKREGKPLVINNNLENWSEIETFYYPKEYINDRSKYNPFKFELKTAEAKPVKIESNRALIISPYINNPNFISGNFGTTDDYYGVWQEIIKKKSCSLYPATAIVNNGSLKVSLQSFKSLSGYGYIHFSTHGDNYFAGLAGIWKPEWGPNGWLKGALSIVVVDSGLLVPKKSDGTFDLTGIESDIKAKRIVLGADGSIYLTPAFFKTYVGALPKSLVTLSSCRSLYNNSLAYAFLLKGAQAVLGYSDYVLSSYAQNTTKKVIQEMLDGKTLKEAYDSAIKTYGKHDGKKKDPAYFLVTGNTNLIFGSGELKNGSFETGNLSSWNKSGDGRVITVLGSATPTDGKYMAIISTGLGYTTKTGEITQGFCVTKDINNLEFNWNFFSEEFMEWCNSKYQDTFEVELCEVDLATGKSSNCSKLFTRKIDDLCSSVTKVNISFDQGDVYATGWQKEVINISGYSGKAVLLKFFATDIGDSIFDTAILIDDIKLTK